MVDILTPQQDIMHGLTIQTLQLQPPTPLPFIQEARAAQAAQVERAEQVEPEVLVEQVVLEAQAEQAEQVVLVVLVEQEQQARQAKEVGLAAEVLSLSLAIL
jgi:hypothetical protein